MKTIFHAMITYIATRGRISEMDLAAVCYPDAVRAYTGCRQVSHFEGDSWMTYPQFMCEKYIPSSKGYYDAGTLDIEGALGKKTNLTAFKDHNRDLPVWLYRNIEAHLVQDMIFDKFIRNVIDESKKKQDIYYVKWGEKFMNAKELRKLLTKFEDQLYPVIQDAADRILHKRVPFDEVKDVLSNAFERAYPEDLCDRTLSYMVMNDKIKKDTDDQIFPKTDLALCHIYQADALIREMIKATKKIYEF